MPQKKNLRFRIFHDSHKLNPFSRIELGKTVLLIDPKAIYIRKQSYGTWSIRKEKQCQAGFHNDLNVHTAFFFKGKKLSITYSIKRGGGPWGEHTKLKAYHGSDIIGNIQAYRGTIGAGMNGNCWPYLEGEDWKLVFHYQSATRETRGIFSIDYFEKMAEAKSFSTGESASLIHDKIISTGIENLSVDLNNINPVVGWEFSMEDEGFPGGVLRCIRYPGYQYYTTKIYGKYRVKEWLATLNPFIAQSVCNDALEFLEWETLEKTQRGYLWSPVQIAISRA